MSDDPTTTGAEEAEASEGRQQGGRKVVRLPEGETMRESILWRAIEKWKNEEGKDKYLRDVLKNEQTGEPGFGFRTTMAEHLGELNCQYGPIAAVDRLFEEITHEVNASAIRFNPPGVEPFAKPLPEVMPDPEDRNALILDTVFIAAYFLVAGAAVEVTHALRRNYRHAIAYAVTVMQSRITENLLAQPDMTHARIDVKGTIEKAISLHADEERAMMNTMLETIPHVFTHKAPGRPPRWTRLALRRLLISALRQLPEDSRTVKGLYAWMSRHRPERLPKNVEAFKQLLYDHKLTLKGLKAEAARKARKFE